MGDSIITARGGTGGGGSGGGAILRVSTISGVDVTCINESQSQTKTSYGTVDFSVGYGMCTISAIWDGITRTDSVVVDALKIYNINLSRITYGIQIDMDTSDPTSAVSYIDNAVGMTPLSCDTATTGACNYGSWGDIITNWIGCKPCLWSNGKRVAYLNPNDYTKKIDGSSADITSGNSGDVMVEFAKRWYKFSSPNANTLKFEIADYDRSADGFTTAAFLSEDGTASNRDYFYYGAYNGSTRLDKLRSLSSHSLINKINYPEIIRMAANNNASCTIETLFKRMYILGLLMLVSKSRDLQVKIGCGFGIGHQNREYTGTMNNKGLFYGKNNYESGVKCFGIEHMWGNIANWMSGLLSIDGLGTLGIKSCAPYSIDGSTSLNINSGCGSGGGFPIQYCSFADGAIIIPRSFQMATATGWPDFFYISTSPLLVPIVGGAYSEGMDRVGPFLIQLSNGPSNGYDSIGARLVAS